MTFDHLWKGRTFLRQTTMLTRDPVTIGAFILGGLGTSTAFIATGLGTFLAGAVGYFVTTVITSFALAALTKKNMGADNSGTIANTREAAAPHEYIYGRMRKGGNITYLESTGTNNSFLHMILCLAGHEIDAVEDIYINDTVVTLDGSGFVTSAPWNSKIRIKKHLGSPTQTVDTDLLAESAQITSDFRGQGIAYLYIRLEYDRNVFTNGIPLITALIRGKKVYDPRTTTTAWSNNAALCVRDYIAADYGVNSPNDIDEAMIAAQATICDDTITLPDTTTIAKFVCNGILSSTNTRRAALTAMMSACSGELFYSTGLFKLVVGDYTAPSKNFTDADLRGGIAIDPKITRRSNFNTVTGTFFDAAQGYIATDFKKVTDSAFVTEDGGIVTPLDLPLSFTTNAALADYLAKLTLYRSREQMTLTAPFSLKAIDVSVGETITLTLAKYGWTAKEFEVVGWNLELVKDGEQVGAIQVNLVLKETSATVYSRNPSTQTILANNTNLPSPFDVITPSSVAATNTGFLSDDGSFLPAITVSWATVTNPFQTKFKIRWKKASESIWQSRETDSETFTIQGVVTGVQYNITVEAINIYEVRSSRISLNFTPGADTTAPSSPTWVSATGVPNGILLEWDNPADTDFKHVRIYENTVNNFATSTQISTQAGSVFNRGNLAGNVTRYYWLKAVDYSRNVSAVSASISATSRSVDDTDVTNGAITQTHLEHMSSGTITITASSLATRVAVIPSFTPSAAFKLGAGTYGAIIFTMTFRMNKTTTDAARIKFCIDYWDGAAWQIHPGIDIGTSGISVLLTPGMETLDHYATLINTDVRHLAETAGPLRISAFVSNSGSFTSPVAVDEGFVMIHQLNK